MSKMLKTVASFLTVVLTASSSYAHPNHTHTHTPGKASHSKAATCRQDLIHGYTPQQLDPTWTCVTRFTPQTADQFAKQPLQAAFKPWRPEQFHLRFDIDQDGTLDHAYSGAFTDPYGQYSFIAVFTSSGKKLTYPLFKLFPASHPQAKNNEVIMFWPHPLNKNAVVFGHCLECDTNFWLTYEKGELTVHRASTGDDE